MKNKLTKNQKDLIEDQYDIIRWIDADTALVHYWDDDNGDFYLEEKATDLLDNTDINTFKDLIRASQVVILQRSGRIPRSVVTNDGRSTCTFFDDEGHCLTSKEIKAQLTDAGYRLAYELTVNLDTTEVWHYGDSEVSSDGHTLQDKQ